MNINLSVGEVVTIILLVVGLIAWFIRLESKVIQLEKNQASSDESYTALEREMNVKFDTLQQTMNSVLMGIGRLEGRMDSKNG